MLIRDFPEYYRWYSHREFSYNGITQYNRNSLLWRGPDVDGMKTGYTRAAGHCLVSSAARNGMRLIATVLGADSEPARTEATQTLLEHGFGRYETRLLYQANVPTATVRVWLGDADRLPVGLNQDLIRAAARSPQPPDRQRLRICTRRCGWASRSALHLMLDRNPYAEHPLIAPARRGLRQLPAAGLRPDAPVAALNRA